MESMVVKKHMALSEDKGYPHGKDDENPLEWGGKPIFPR